jgi:hypothetical protein
MDQLRDELAAFNFKAKKKKVQAVQKNLSQSRAEGSPPVDVESHSTLCSISHVTLGNLTRFLSFLLDFNAASANHQE